MARNPHRVWTRDQLLEAVSRHDEPPADRMIDACVSRHRKKTGNRDLIETVTGVGYKFVAVPAADTERDGKR